MKVYSLLREVEAARANATEELASVAQSLRTLLRSLQAADVAPTTQMTAAVAEVEARARKVLQP